MVPFGPKLDFITSCRPFAALMFMKSAAALDMISALGFTDFRELEAMVVGVSVTRLTVAARIQLDASRRTFRNKERRELFSFFVSQERENRREKCKSSTV